MTNFDPQDTTHGEWGGGDFFPKDGPHLMEVKPDLQYRRSSSDNPMLEITFEIVAGPDRGKEIRFQYYVLTGKGAAKFRQLCLAINPKMQAFDPENRPQLVKALCNHPFIGTCKSYEEEYQGAMKRRCRVDLHRAATKIELAAFVKTVTDDDIPF